MCRLVALQPMQHTFPIPIATKNSPQSHCSMHWATCWFPDWQWQSWGPQTHRISLYEHVTWQKHMETCKREPLPKYPFNIRILIKSIQYIYISNHSPLWTWHILFKSIHRVKFNSMTSPSCNGFLLQISHHLRSLQPFSQERNHGRLIPQGIPWVAPHHPHPMCNKTTLQTWGPGKLDENYAMG